MIRNNFFLRYLLIFLASIAIGIAIGKYLCQSGFWGTPNPSVVSDGPIPRIVINERALEIAPFENGNPYNAVSARFVITEPSGATTTRDVNVGDPPQLFRFGSDNNNRNARIDFEYTDKDGKELPFGVDLKHTFILDEIVIMETPPGSVAIYQSRGCIENREINDGNLSVIREASNIRLRLGDYIAFFEIDPDNYPQKVKFIGAVPKGGADALTDGYASLENGALILNFNLSTSYSIAIDEFETNDDQVSLIVECNFDECENEIGRACIIEQ